MKIWGGNPQSVAAARAKLLQRAKETSLAARGQYTPTAEHETQFVTA
jgi:hypothetical protein